jgi:hypothetical protein
LRSLFRFMKVFLVKFIIQILDGAIEPLSVRCLFVSVMMQTVI